MAVKRIDLDLAPAGSISTAAKQEYAYDMQFSSLAPPIPPTIPTVNFTTARITNGKDYPVFFG